eukprot:3296189-Pleurochrysis_carterae.AAC.1
MEVGAGVLSSMHMRGWQGPRPLRMMEVAGSAVQRMNLRLGSRPLHGRVMRNKGGCERRMRRNRRYIITTTKTIIHDAR